MNLLAAPHKIVVNELQSDELQGLTSVAIEKKRSVFGKNISYLRRRKSLGMIFVGQFLNPLIVVLLLVSTISLFVDEVMSGVIIFVMLFVNAVVGTIQEVKAEKSLEKLSKLVKFTVRVVREGKVQTVEQEELVPGDIVLLKTGEVVPADIRLIEAVSLSVNEATLTGESLPVYKDATGIEYSGTTPQELKGSVFMGTAIVGGHGKGIVVSTGKATFLGQIIESGSNEVPTRFEKDLKSFSDSLLRFVLLFSGITGAINIFLGRDVITSLMLGITLALGITPEILPIVVTIAMSAGAFALAKKKVIVRRLSAIEDLGGVDILCTDKTGTLTTGEISLVGVYDEKGNKEASLSELAYLCSSEFPGMKDVSVSNVLDTAIAGTLSKEIKKELDKTVLIDCSDFDFVKKRMLALVNYDGQKILIKKGASEFVIRSCMSFRVKGEDKRLTTKKVDEIMGRIQSYEAKGFRVISIATENLGDSARKVGDSSRMTFRGFLVFQDPPRYGVVKDIKELEHLQVSLKILTGDSAAVTRQIAEAVGLEVKEEDVISGAEIDKVRDADFASTVEKYRYFVRVTPLHKQRIIESLKKNGHTVGYMGDGINDVGALKIADVGISVENATPVTKDVSDLLLMEKNLSALGVAIVQGRKTFSNTLKFITNTMSSSFGNVLTAAVASLFLPYIPLLPAQLLLIDSLSDMQHLSFATDNIDKELSLAPRSWDKKFMGKFIFVFGSLSTGFDFIHMGIFASVARSPELFRTLWFVESIVTEMLATFSVRTRKPLFRSTPSKGLLITTLTAIALAILIPMTGIGQTFFGFTSLQGWHYLLIAGVVVAYLLALELTKHFFYKRSKITYGSNSSPVE